MTSIEPKRFNWLPTPSAWEEAQVWRERRRAMADQFESQATTFTSSFVTTLTNQINGYANLAAKAALSRIKAAAKAKGDELTALATSAKIDKIA